MMRTPKVTLMMVAGLLGLGLMAGCGSPDEPTEMNTDGPEQVNSSSPAPEASPSSDPTPSDAPQETTTDPQPPADDDELAAGFAAVELAEAEVPGSQAVGLDHDDDGEWEVEVFADGRKTDYTISADGTRIVERDDDDDDDDDNAELAARVSQIQVPLPDAVRNAIVSADGTLDQVDLDDHRGTVVWEVELDTPNGDVEVHVDVATGDIL